jgi:hypothetical protein
LKRLAGPWILSAGLSLPVFDSLFQHPAGAPPESGVGVARFLWTPLRVGKTEFGAPVTHQDTQVADAHSGYFMHPDEQRCTDRYAAMADFADDRGLDFEETRESGVVFELHFLMYHVEQLVRVVRLLRCEMLLCHD